MTIAIIGGGAAGMMAAASARATNPEAKILLLERNNGLGKKVIISGGGRCNVTTGIHDIDILLTKYPRGNPFLKTAFIQFPPNEVYRWFEEHGVPLKTQADNRVFPQSDDGHDIVRVFNEFFAEHAVDVRLNTHVTGIEKIDGKFVFLLRDHVSPLIVDRLILTTGGQAYRQTGSTGDGYAFAQSLGHTITPLAPSLNSFFTKETWPTLLSGVSFTNATITAHRSSVQSFTGPFLFTHKGISGPAVFALSSLVAFETYGPQNPLNITINFFPQKTHTQMLADLKRSMETHPKKTVLNILATFVPKSLTDIIATNLNINEQRRAAEIGKKDLALIATWLTALPLTVVGRGAGDEFVTAGGVPTEEVDPTTMQSLITPGLFFAGEILNVDGFTGGFNLQASWAAGRLAGISAAL
jgi:predicted Rossmann fold flavoprotein